MKVFRVTLLLLFVACFYHVENAPQSEETQSDVQDGQETQSDDYNLTPESEIGNPEGSIPDDSTEYLSPEDTAENAPQSEDAQLDVQDGQETQSDDYNLTPESEIGYPEGSIPDDSTEYLSPEDTAEVSRENELNGEAGSEFVKAEEGSSFGKWISNTFTKENRKKAAAAARKLVEKLTSGEGAGSEPATSNAEISPPSSESSSENLRSVASKPKLRQVAEKLTKNVTTANRPGSRRTTSNAGKSKPRSKSSTGSATSVASKPKLRQVKEKLTKNVTTADGPGSRRATSNAGKSKPGSKSSSGSATSVASKPKLRQVKEKLTKNVITADGPGPKRATSNAGKSKPPLKSSSGSSGASKPKPRQGAKTASKSTKSPQKSRPLGPGKG